MYRFACLLTVIVSLQTAGAAADETQLRRLIEDYVSSFNEHDAESVSSFWSAKGTHVDGETGVKTNGREAIRQDLEAVFAERPSTQLSGQIESMRLIKPDVGMIEGSAVLTVDEESSQTSFTALVIKDNGKWLIDRLTEIPIVDVEPPAVDSVLASDKLSVLDWLEGRWIDPNEAGQVDIDFRWSPNRNFLIRTTLARSEEGAEERSTQVVGWDARSQQIRSWTFNSDGSFGDAVWYESGGNWLIKSSQSLANGDAASGTFVLTRVDENELSLQLIGHEVEGRPQPASMSVSVFRVDDSEQESTTK